MISVATFPKGQASSNITSLFVFLTDFKIVSVSKGLTVLKSIISHEIFSFANSSAALYASLIIFPKETKIKNLLGFQGSFISDLFFQSFGFIAYLISFTYIITGINIFRLKDFFLIIENTFIVILYTIVGTLFLNYFYSDAFTLYINGNGGFVGNYLNQTFLNNIIQINEDVFYLIIIIIILFLFLISINFRLKNFFIFLKKVVNIFFKKVRPKLDASTGML